MRYEVVDSRIVLVDGVQIRVCTTHNTGLAIGSFRVPFCPECCRDHRALYCSTCDNPLHVLASSRPFCTICRYSPSLQDTYFKGTNAKVA